MDKGIMHTTRLDLLYTDEHKHRTYKEIDELVHRYQAAENDDKQQLLATLLRAFHKYFMKYVALLKGYTNNINHYDTLAFLALFVARKDKTMIELRNAHFRLIKICAQFEPGDIYNELCSIFIELLNNFEFRDKTYFLKYITKYMRWSTRAWLIRVARNPLNKSKPIYDQDYEDSIVPPQEDDDLGAISPMIFKMNLAWMVAPEDELFKTLTVYERFLLYLRYKDGLSLRQMSTKLGKSKDTINQQTKIALTKLQEAYQEGD